MLEEIKEEILRYVKLKLKEQRAICLENIEYGDNDIEGEDMYSVRESSILNAPEPNLLDLLNLIHEKTHNL